MPIIAQQPTRLDLIGVAGDPFSLLITFTITDEADNPVPWADVTDPSVTIIGPFQRNTPAAAPTITSPETGQLLLSWSAAQTPSISQQNKWALSVTISGQGPCAVVAGLISMFPDTTAGTSGSTSADLSVLLGTATVAVAVTLGGGGVVIGGNSWLIQNALSEAFTLTGSQTYDPTYGTLTGSNVLWPDGTSGAYTATLQTTGTNPGGVTSFTVTYVGATTKTVTGTIPRNSSGQVSGDMTAVVS